MDSGSYNINVQAQHFKQRTKHGIAHVEGEEYEDTKPETIALTEGVSFSFEKEFKNISYLYLAQNTRIWDW